MKKLKNSYTDVYGFFIQKKNINKNSVEKIFSLLRVDTTFKTTSFNRMADLNIKLKKYIKKFFSKNIIICDFGVSSGQQIKLNVTALRPHNVKAHDARSGQIAQNDVIATAALDKAEATGSEMRLRKPFIQLGIFNVEQNAKKGLEFADIGYVLVSGETAIAGKGDDLLDNPDVGRLFLGG